MPLISLTPAGLYCEAGDFHIDPWRPVSRAVITHAHSDHASTLRAESRARGVEGMMLKRRDSAYGVGRVRGAWWKWKIDPYTVDAVIIYAQRGHGRRAGLYTDYTFGVWDDETLVPFAKAYSGLTDAEIREVDRFVREHTVEKFGPVRVVEPALVCELAFEAIQLSTEQLATRVARMQLAMQKPGKAKRAKA